MHIVIDARELRTSSGRYVERLLYYLQNLDANSERQYTVLLTPKDMPGWQPTAANFTTAACDHKEFTFDEQLGLKQQITELKPDLVHFTFPQQPVLYRGKTITTVHDLTTIRFSNPDKNPLVFKLKQQIYKQVIKRATKKSVHVITPTEFVKQDVSSFAGIEPDKITATLESADPITEPAETVTGLQGKQFIMYVGRPTPHKNLSRLIEAFESLEKQHPDLLLVLAGKKDANYRRIESTVQERDLSGVIFTDFVTEGQLRWLYENCAVYVFPSLSEGFGLPGLEAMQHGSPVVSSNATCLPEVYGDAAHYFDPTDTAAMASAIDDVLSDTSLHDSLVRAGREQVKKYSWQRMAEQTLAIYKQALKD